MTAFEFDPRKNRANVEKHGVDFATAIRLWDDLVFEWEDERKDYGEQRFIALGMIESRVFVIVYTWRGIRRRLISARKANTHEKQIYQSAVARITEREKD